MRSPRFKDPKIFVVKGNELPISGIALLTLMREVLARGLPFRFCARGWSMAPFIKNGDVITVAPLQRSFPGIGEVIAFVRPGEERLVVHRVVGWRNNAAIFQGDNYQEHTEEIVPQENLLGKVTQIERNGHKIWLGLGPERYVIAQLSRAKLLLPLYTWLSICLRLVTQRHK